ncbi:3-deoxy-manno-octulosonate cytidylyltransferase [Methanomethylophilus alvi]|uniref:3-deoxy-manno-octulosonate cytidylyltransferase n=1 Tax=Methanomethylophilus alvi TaxID=1291540 RepID=UPI0037DD87F9
MKIVAIIPARYKSSRFPGKPLSDIFGKPMIWWVYQHCQMVPEFDEVYVATDDERIRQSCESLDMNVIMTSENNPTGTDRIGEVAEEIVADLYVNVQGDEPLMEPSVMSSAIRPFFNDPDLLVSNCMTKIRDPVEVVNFTIPKVITNKDGIALYLTRSTAPYPKGSINYDYFKQVCVYGFKPEALKFFYEYGKKYGKAKMENIEDIEILRFIENGYKVQFVEVESNSVAVDTPKDLEKVRGIIDEMIKNNEVDIKLT